MAKVKSKTVVVKCQCSICHQVAFVVAGAQHFFCNGIKVEGGQMATHLYNRIKHPDRKGVWEPV